MSRARKVHLVLVTHGDMDPQDLVGIRAHLRSMDRSIRTWILTDRRKYALLYPLLAVRPTLTISFVELHRLRPWRGRVMTGQWLRKSEEYAALEKAGVPVPRWRLVEEGKKPDLAEFPPHVVVKPDGGARGAEVKIMRKGRVRHRPWSTDVGVQSDALIAQEFVYTGPWPVSYRVTTFLGRVLWVQRHEMVSSQEAITPDADGLVRDWSGQAITSAGKGKSKSCLTSGEQDIEALAEKAHLAFPEIPLLGVDIVRDPRTNKSYVIEVNASGWVWHLSSRRGLGASRPEGFTPEFYAESLKKTARILANQVEKLSR